MNPTSGLRLSAMFFTVFWTAGMLWWRGTLQPASVIFTVIGGYDWFYRGELPWVGLIACVVASAALLYCAAINFARHDF